VAAAVALVDAGGVVAVHDEDGHHLVCDATQPRAVAVLRGRRCDWARPLPVMVSDREVARCLATLTADEERLLMASGCPIVLATARRSKPPLAAGVNPVGDRVGLCLPSTPLQHLLVDMLDRPLVVTEDGAVGLAHGGDDAPVGTLVVGDPDDRKAGPAAVSSRSVAWVVDGRPALLRRGRGEASVPLRLPVPACQPMLAMGADGTFALAKGEWAYVVEPDARSVRPTLDERLDHVRRCLDVAPEVVVQDLHPDDLSTKLASRWPRSCRVAVQHHHAHVAACAAEHDIDEAFVGVAYDSPRLGDDGTLWGGEVLVGDLRAAYRRAGRFAAAPLPGGLPALRRPARVALGYLLAGERLGNASVPSALVESYLRRLPAREVETVRRMTDTGVNSPLTSSAAALVGAVACLLGLKEDTSFDSEAGLALEAAARGQRAEELPWRVVDHDDVRVYDPSLTVAALLAGLRDGAPVSALAAGFHATMASVTVALCVEAAREVRSNVVCLSGDVFVNRLLATSVADALRSAGFLVYGNERVPCGDASVGYGQLAVAAARLAWHKVMPPRAGRP
jgi:hydrogenase maturation protein HypF